MFTVTERKNSFGSATLLTTIESAEEENLIFDKGRRDTGTLPALEIKSTQPPV